MVSKLWALTAGLAQIVAASAASSSESRAVHPIPGGWPYTPFTTNGRDIINAAGKKVVYAGVNWPGAAETMLPEGLQYNSISNIVAMIKSLGMNTIRLTYATEMVDDFHSNSPNQTLKNTLINALGVTNGTAVLQQILKNNPQLTEQTTRLQVFDHVALECAVQEIWVHLDNHVSKASWCCNPFDGNSWWGDTYFNTLNWLRGHQFMANRVKYWTALSSMALRNELRPALPKAGLEPINWATWYKFMTTAANLIYAKNTSPLIFFSGLTGDVDLSAITQGTDLGNGTKWTPSSFAFQKKIVYELHNYLIGGGAANNPCSAIETNLYKSGYGAMNLSDPTFPNKGPMVMTEYGFDMSDGSWLTTQPQCIPNFTTHQPGGPGGLMQWVLAGSYYIRQGQQDADESWGILSHDWKSFRNETVVNNYIKPWVKATLA